MTAATLQPVRLVADIGGTNARFALSDAPGRLRDVRTYRTADYESFPTALKAYLRDCGRGGNSAAQGIAAAFLAGAGPVDGDEICLTNSPWRICGTEIAGLIGGPVRLFNDLEAVALALPHLSEGDARPLWHTESTARGSASGPRLAVNVGTGFGAAIARRDREDRWSATATEAGHMTFAARGLQEHYLLDRFEVVEDVLSGRGLVDLFRELETWDSATERVEAEIGAQFILAERAKRSPGASPPSPQAMRALRMFAAILGRVSGDLVLAHAAWGGVYLCGSVAAEWARGATNSDILHFKQGFIAKGKMTGRMQAVGVHALTVDEPALVGLTFAPA